MKRVAVSLVLPLSLGLSACGGGASAPTSVIVAPTPTGAVSAAVTPGITEILGRPTDHWVTVSARSDKELDVYFEYGRAPGTLRVRHGHGGGGGGPVRHE